MHPVVRDALERAERTVAAARAAAAREDLGLVAGAAVAIQAAGAHLGRVTAALREGRPARVAK